METLSQQIAGYPPSPLFHYEKFCNKTTETKDMDDSGVEYPESDGEPMGETEIHVLAILDLFQALRHFFRNHQDVYVAADMLLYYEKGNPKKFKVPDVMVIKGVAKHRRRIFKLWEEKVPCAIFEITSKSTAKEDVAKSEFYASIGVKEYFIFDPLQEYMEDNFAGFRLDGTTYAHISPDKDGLFFSKELGALLKRKGDFIRVIDPETGKPVPTFEEESRRAEEESRRAEEESRRAEEESRRADEESRRADEEAKKSARLAAKLKEMGIDPESVL